VGFFVGRDRGDLDVALLVVVQFEHIRVDSNAYRIALTPVIVHFHSHDNLLALMG
jgi:hypothetical protein